MKKTLSLFIATIMAIGLLNAHRAFATYNVVPKAPKISESLKPIILKYRNENYVGAMIDLEELVKKEKNNTYAKYYLALCYTRLGYREEAQILYNEVAEKDENLALTHYSKRAMTCLANPNDESCSPKKPSPEDIAKSDDIEAFIRSGRQIHPSAMDRITRERMERKLQADAYKKQQAEQQAQQIEMNGEKVSLVPTNEEIASALNTLSKIGMNPYTQNQNLANMNSFNQFGYYNQNNLLPMMLQGNTNPEIAKLYLYNQMNQQQNSLINYGI